jgi:hypothetical protein
MTSGGRKQFAALYPNSDEPGHRLNSRPTSAIYRTDSLALISTAETIPFVSQNSRPSPRRALSSFFTTFNFRLPASSRMVASLGASVWPHAIPCVLNHLGRSVRTSDTGDPVFRIHRLRTRHTGLCRLQLLDVWRKGRRPMNQGSLRRRRSQ